MECDCIQIFQLRFNSHLHIANNTLYLSKRRRKLPPVAIKRTTKRTQPDKEIEKMKRILFIE